MRVRLSVFAATALIVFAAAAPQAANSASIDSAFRSAVANVLNSVRSEQEFLRNLSAAEFKDFVACAQNVMAAAPTGRKQFVLDAPNQREMRQRFDKVALDNRAALKQRISRECS